MKKDSFASRLQKALNMNNYKQVDLVNKSHLDKTLINKYLNGVAEAKQDKLTILADSLSVNEIWLMGYDVPFEREWSGMIHDDEKKMFIFKHKTNNEDKKLGELELLFNKNKDILTKEDEEYIKFIIDQRKKKIDEQTNNK